MLGQLWSVTPGDPMPLAPKGTSSCANTFTQTTPIDTIKNNKINHFLKQKEKQLLSFVLVTVETGGRDWETDLRQFAGGQTALKQARSPHSHGFNCWITCSLRRGKWDDPNSHPVCSATQCPSPWSILDVLPTALQKQHHLILKPWHNAAFLSQILCWLLSVLFFGLMTVHCVNRYQGGLYQPVVSADLFYLLGTNCFWYV